MEPGMPEEIWQRAQRTSELLGEGRQVATTGELVDLVGQLPRDTPVVVEPVLRAPAEVAPGQSRGVRSLTVAVTSSLSVLELSGLAAPAGTYPDGLPYRHRMPAVGDHPRATELQARGWNAAALPFLANHLFELAEQVYDQPDLPPDSRERRQLQDLAGVLHEVSDRIAQLAPSAQAAFAVAEVFEDEPQL